MNIDTMRRIDRLAGVPLCAVATLLVRIRDWLHARSVRPARRILFIELSEMGSTVLASPAMRKARAQLSAELYFVIFTRNVGSLQLVGAIAPDNIFTISDASIFTLARDTLAFLWWTRRKGIDTVVDLELFSRFTALLAGFCGADRRVGFYRFYQEGLYRGEMLTHRVTYNAHIHVAKNFIALIDALIAPQPTTPYAKTLIGDDQVNVEIVRGQRTVAWRRARTHSQPRTIRSGATPAGADQSERQRTLAAPALDAGSFRRTDPAHPRRL